MPIHRDPNARSASFVAQGLVFASLVASGACKDSPLNATEAQPSPSAQVKAPGPAPAGMAWIPAGTFFMGSDDPMYPDAQPVHAVKLSGFWMDTTEVTNEAFQRFVAATGHQTIAEQAPRPEDFPGAPPSALVPGSVTFQPPDHDVSLHDPGQWWAYRAGVNWRHPEGPESAIAERMNHPVVHVAWTDAAAYCAWMQKRLPTEAEWEHAARGGLDRKRFAWGDELKPGNLWAANVWQGRFPAENKAEDGFVATAPVAHYKANAFGLFDVAGNVWEWTADLYHAGYYAESPTENPRGPSTSLDPREPGVEKRAMRGGSFLCSDLYCVRYAVGARGKGAPDTGSSHLGFRCAKSES